MPHDLGIVFRCCVLDELWKWQNKSKPWQFSFVCSGRRALWRSLKYLSKIWYRTVVLHSMIVSNTRSVETPLYLPRDRLSKVWALATSLAGFNRGCSYLSLLLGSMCCPALQLRILDAGSCCNPQSFGGRNPFWNCQHHIRNTIPSFSCASFSFVNQRISLNR